MTALPIQQPLIVGPSYLPALFKVVSQITAGKCLNLEDLLAGNIPITELEPQLWLDGHLVLLHTPKTPKLQITDIVEGGLFYFLPHSLFTFSASLERSSKLQTANITNISSVWWFLPVELRPCLQGASTCSKAHRLVDNECAVV